MRIKRIKLTNIARHKSLDIDCDTPVFGIIGANGAGKSSVLDAIAIGLTGESECKLDSYVTHGAAKGIIELSFFTDQEGTIIRELGRTSKRLLKWDGAEITRAKEVDETLAQVLKADKAAVRSAIFIKQGSLQNMLFAKQSEKEDLFVELVNLSYCQKRVQVVDGKIKKLQTCVVDLTPQRLALEAQHTAAVEVVNTLQAELNSLRDMKSDVDDCLSRLSDLSALEQLELKVANLMPQHFALERDMAAFDGRTAAAVTARCAGLAAGHQVLQTKLQTLQRGISELRMRHNVEERVAKSAQAVADIQVTLASLNKQELTQTVEQCRFALRGNEECVRITATQARQRQVLQMTQQILKSKKAPSVSRKQLTDMQLQRGTLRFEYEQLTEWLKFREKIKGCIDKTTGMCPECGLKVSNPDEVNEDEIAKLSNTVIQKQAAFNALERDCREALATLESYEQQCAQLSATIQNVSVELAELASLKAEVAGFDGWDVAGTKEAEAAASSALVRLGANEIALRNSMAAKVRDEAELAKFTQKLDPEKFNDAAFLTAKSEADAAYAYYQQELATKDFLVKATADLENILKARQDLEDQIAVIHQRMSERLPLVSSDGSEVICTDELTLLLAALRQRQEARSQKIGETNQARLTADNFSRELAELMRRIDKDEKVLACIDKLQSIKTILSDLPTQFVRYKFTQIAEATQRHLAELTGDFSVSIDPERALSFQFARSSQEQVYTLPQEKLSGGQKVRLSLAFLLAVQEVLVSEVGLLVLDEPTISLDTEGVDSLAQFLKELNVKIQNSNIQVIIVDHHPLLIQSFDKCLTLN